MTILTSRHLFSLTLCVLLATSAVAAEPRELCLSAAEENAICQIATDESMDSAARPLRHSTRQSEARDQAVYLASEWLELAFDGRNGSLIQIYDTVTNHAHLIDRGEGRSGFWNFKATAKNAGENADNDHKTNVLIAPGNANSFRWEKSNDEGRAIRLIWSDFSLPAAADLAVEVHVKLDGHVPASAWRLTIRSPARLSVEEIHFPIVSGIACQDDEVLAVPHWMGEKLANPRHLLAGREGAGRRLQWSYPGHLSLQCVAYYRDNGPGLYTACHDATCQRKSFAIWGDKNSQVHGIAVASIVDRPLQLSIDLDMESYGLAHDARIERIDEAGRSSIGNLDPKQPSLRLELRPLQACVLDITTGF